MKVHHLILGTALAFGMISNANANREILLREDPVSILINANGALTCHAGTEPPLFPTETHLVARIGPDPFGFSGVKHNIENVRLRAGVGDQCGKFASLFNQPNPHWLTLKGTRRLVETFEKEFSNRCGHYLRETMELTIEGTSFTLSEELITGLSFVPLERCD